MRHYTQAEFTAMRTIALPDDTYQCGGDRHCVACRRRGVNVPRRQAKWEMSALANRGMLDDRDRRMPGSNLKYLEDRMRSITAVNIFVFGIALAGCATITTGSDDLVTIDTDPNGAICRLTAGGRQVAVINPTPGSLKVPKSRKDLTVRCDKDGYFPSEGVIESKFQGMTFGNILFGGIIGIIIDASSGASNNYDDGVLITLIPEGFPTTENRDNFFDKMETDFLARYDVIIAEINEKCEAGDTCESQLKGAGEKRDTKLAEIAAMRAKAKIGNSSQSELKPELAVTAYTALPNGITPPYEGVKISSYSASDMRWFCSQEWETRRSPTGRTEYNPCHRPDSFSK